jgi:multidrug efflux pump subunit AcrB
MILSDVSIKNPGFAWMLMFGLIFFGFLCFWGMGLSQMPDIEFPVVNISITRLNASALVMESDVADIVEDAVLGVEGVQDVQTTCTLGNVNISVFLDMSRNPDVAVQEVQTAVFQVEKQLPTDVYPPVIKKQDPNSSPIFWLAVTADPPLTSRDLMLYTRDTLKDQFTSLPGVSTVSLGGWIDRQVNILADNNQLNSRQLTADDIVNTIANQHAEVPVGYMETPKTEYEVRSMGEAASVKEFEELPVIIRGSNPNYQYTTLKDVAKVEDGLAPVTRLSRFNGIPAVGLGIVMLDGYNAVDLVKDIKAQMAKVIPQLPKGYHLLTNFDTTVSIKENIHELELTIFLAALLTALVCYFFLGSWSSTLNVFLAIPTSLFGTFIIIKFFGFTLNMFTLLALSLSIGIVVDDAIMVLENIMRHQEEGEGMMEAALKGSREIIFAAMATSVAIVAIFLPVAFMSGVIGKFFFQFGVTLSGAVMISLLEAVTLTPMRCSQFVRKADETKGLNFWVRTRMKRLIAFYGKLLKWCLAYRADRLMDEAKSGKWPLLKSLASKIIFSHPKALMAEVKKEKPLYSLRPVLWLVTAVAVLALARLWNPLAFKIGGSLSLLVFLVYLWKNRHYLFLHLVYDHRWWVVLGAMVIFVGSLGLSGVIKREMVPNTDQGVFIVNMLLPADYSIFRTDGVVKQCEAAIKGRGEIKNLYTAIGGFATNASNSAIFFITMKPPAERPVVGWSEKFPPAGPLAFIERFFNLFTTPRLTQAEFMEVCRNILKKVSPDLQVYLVDLSKRGLSTGRGYDAEFIVSGPEWDKLGAYTAEIKKRMTASPLLADVYDNYLFGLPDIQITPDRRKAALEGVSIEDLGMVLGVLVGGYTFQTVYYHENGHNNNIFVRMPQSQRLTAEDLKKIYTRNNRGELVPVSEVTTVTEVPDFQQITRDNRQRAVFFLANASSKATGQQALDEALRICHDVLPEDYHATLTGTSQAGSQTNLSLMITMALGIIVAYMVLVSQFNSFLQPWVILLALPFSITGALSSLWLFNQSLNMYSLIGLILLLGLVKKNSIMLVSFTNQAREQGMDLTAALLFASPLRLRPILMTSVATVAGALPAALALGPGAELRQPMSVAVIGGIVFSTLLTLVVVPCAYSLMSGWERPDTVRFKTDSEGNLEVDTRKPAR